MSKVIPKKKAKAKKERRKEISDLLSSEAQKKLDRMIRRQLDEMDERADKRFQYAKKILDANSSEVEEAVERMVTMMNHMSGEPRFIVDGVSVAVDPEILLRIQRKLHTWAAVRLLVACAKWDIRVAGFVAPKKVCVDCGRKA